MTETLVRPSTFEFPAPASPFGTLLDVADVQESGGWLGEAQGLVETYNCLTLDSTAIWPCPAAASNKTFVLPSWQDGIRFAVYGGVQCKGPTFDRDEAKARTLASFLAMESMGVERALMTQRFVANGAIWAAAPDLTPASGPVSAAVGLAILEGNAGCNYAGRPIIHMPREVASLLSGVQGSIAREGDHLETKLGALVAAGAGYGCPNTGPTGAAPAAGEYWMYASGAVSIRRTDVFLQADIDRSTNEVYVLAERGYLAVVDCYTAAVRVEVFA